MRKIVEKGLLAFVVLLVSALSACGGPPPSQNQGTPKATHSPTGTVPPAPTDESGNGRIAYPWPMQQQRDNLGATIWVPTDVRVYQELETDFLAYWTWSGQAGPASFPFSPDPTQIALLATSNFQGHLQTYSNQVHSSGQVTAYLASQEQPAQAIQTCTQNGLSCQVYYSFPSATKTTYNAQTGAILSQTQSITLFILVTQSYWKEAQRWQLSALVSQELAG